MLKKLVVLTGAGISAESGIKTFRDSDGLWENYRIEDVCTHDAWLHNTKVVIDFYNQRRKELYNTKPNAAHEALVKLEDKYDIQIITQNIDDLHERAGSRHVLHLHGELKKVRSSVDDDLIYDLDGWELKMGMKCEKGSQLRPHVVFFGEAVPNIMPAAELAQQADIFVVIGTSLAVYPAAGLINYVSNSCPKYLVDPKDVSVSHIPNLTFIRKKAGEGVPELVDKLLAAAE